MAEWVTFSKGFRSLGHEDIDLCNILCNQGHDGLPGAPGEPGQQGLPVWTLCVLWIPHKNCTQTVPTCFLIGLYFIKRLQKMHNACRKCRKLALNLLSTYYLVHDSPGPHNHLPFLNWLSVNGLILCPQGPHGQRGSTGVRGPKGQRVRRLFI